ncbi:MAG: CotH kinase family protein [Candidatus Riflebacteria bacterium]|nr:CotH kinase family protein [Candidatus Riflebacteria bacterium]
MLFQEGAFGKGVASANATLKIRGHASRRTTQKSFQIKLFDKKQPWRNLSTIELNKHPYDLTRVRNKLCFDLFKTLPHMGSLRTQFIHLTIKRNAEDPGKDYGLFTQIESLNEHSLIDHGLDPNGIIYYPEDFFFLRYPDSLRLASDPQYKKEDFEKILGWPGNPDHAKLLAMLDDVNNEALDIQQVMKKHFNLNNYLTWLAMNVLLENQDTYSQNFTLYSPSKGNVWYFLPWDYDGAMGFTSQPDQQNEARLHLRWHQGIANWWDSMLHRRFLKIPGNVALLKAKIEELKNTIFTPEKIKGLLNEYHDTAKSYISRHPDLDYLPVKIPENGKNASDAVLISAFEEEYNRLPSTVEASYKSFISTLERPMPFHLGTVQAEENHTQTAFYWNKSVSLSGDQIQYDLLISLKPDFTRESIVFESLNLSDSQVTSSSPGTAKFSVSSEKIPQETLYWKIIARAEKNPQENWQTAFEFHEENEQLYDGVRSFTKP